MIDQKTLEEFLPFACEWAKAQEDLILASGIPLKRQQLADAERAGVQKPAKVRILVVDRIPLPEQPKIADMARRAQILTTASRGITIGYGIMIRADAWSDRELLVHNLVHVAQHEKNGNLEQTIREYVLNRCQCPKFTMGSLEEEARRLAHEICKGKSTPAGTK